MTARELMKVLDKFEGSAEVMIEVLARDSNGKVETKVVGPVEGVTGNSSKIYIGRMEESNGF